MEWVRNIRIQKFSNHGRNSLAMDRTARQTPFRDLVAHMDGLHSHVKGFVTLTLWVKNPVSLITHRLACMECESEDTTNVIHFLTLYNEILQKVKGDSSFVWSPRGIMTDENGANKNAVRAVLGQAMAARTWELYMALSIMCSKAEPEVP